MGRIVIKSNEDATRDEFFRLDDEGQEWSLGEASECVELKGTPNEYRWFEGRFDTKKISYEDDWELEEWINKHYPNDEIEWR